MQQLLGCDNDGSSGSDTQALTENEFSEDPGLFAEADEGVVVDFLEPPDSEKPENDTGDVGIDIIPYKYTQTLSNTFCWEDDNLEAGHFMTLVDSDGVEVLTVEVNGECVTEVIHEGEYEMQIHHDGETDDTLLVFIEVTDGIEGVEARKSETNHGILKTVRRILSETMRIIGISREARAQSVEENVQTLLMTKRCDFCNLSGTNLAGANLSEANLIRADLSGADLSGADLSRAVLFGADVSFANLNSANLSFADLRTANLSGSDLRSANLLRANLRQADLTRAKLTMANLRRVDLIRADLVLADLSGADLSGAVLTEADLGFASLVEANLSGANLTEADLTGANLTGAVWTNGSVCLPGSVGTCIQ